MLIEPNRGNICLGSVQSSFAKWEKGLFPSSEPGKEEETVKAVILAGGMGTRISEESYLRPKPMIEIGGKPVAWLGVCWFINCLFFSANFSGVCC
jgi:nucleotidyltransferase-like protein